jgi:hypothetical protein
MDTQALVLMGDVDPVPEGGSIRFGYGLYSRMTFFIEQTLGDQSRFKLIKLRLDISLQAVYIEVFDVGMAALAGRNVLFKGVNVAVTHVAANAGIFHHCSVRAGAAFGAGASKAKQHGALRTVVGTPVGAGDLDHAVNCFINLSTRLVAVGAQVALAAVEGYIFEG